MGANTAKVRKKLWQQRKRRAFVVRGLTIKGTPRVNRRWPELARLTPVERHRMRCRFYMRKRFELGLTARGGQRKHNIGHFPATKFGQAYVMREQERAWRTIRAEMNLP